MASSQISATKGIMVWKTGEGGRKEKGREGEGREGKIKGRKEENYI